ncbi:hypothetical protein ISN44_As10g012710 [Arabidopsis suecica]|uniref:Uncharacterized protein n=1 Tax=Arabidopsis suecica TaxID=45249 RepID=A0A8T1ZY46_ARASU|nr:hypothetical protein ISN44_As10g012710 [Arabidopsis suecica]
MRKWLMRIQPFINVASVLSIQELMNSMPRRCYDEDGVVHPVLSKVDGVSNVYVLANHFRASGTVYEEDCPITEAQVYLDESRTTEGCGRIIPSICEVHSVYDYIDKYELVLKIER